MRWMPYLIAGGVSLPWLYFAATGTHPADLVTAALTGVAILGAAFLLSWACEVAEMDVPQALAVSVLALIAVLPEYAVDATFAWKAGEWAAANPGHSGLEPGHINENAGYAIANMTGGNRLLLGLGWSLLAIIGYLRTRETRIELPRDMGADVTILLCATMYAVVPVMRGSLNLFDTAVYGTLYVLYLVAAARGEEHEGELVGPAKQLEGLTPTWRRVSVVFLFVFAASVIFISAEPFAEALVHTGKSLGIDEFVLVQWLAPLASESPEVVVAVLLVWRGHRSKGLRTLVSSNVNQWTLLVGTLSVVYSIAAGGPAALPLDDRQQAEVLLTAAMCLFAAATIADLKFVLWQAAALTGLFMVAVFLPHLHFAVGATFLVLALGIFVVEPGTRAGLIQCVRTFVALLRGRTTERSGEGAV